MNLSWTTAAVFFAFRLSDRDRCLDRDESRCRYDGAGSRGHDRSGFDGGGR
jgi:hypothetical protein